jgi:hypothetical protein
MTSQEPAPGYDPLLFVLGIQAHHSVSLFTYDSPSPRFVFWLMFIIHRGDLGRWKEEQVVAKTKVGSYTLWDAAKRKQQ